MLIQCQACASRYRLDLQKIPERKAFVRCKNCGHPIYIDGEEEAPAQPAVLSAWQESAPGLTPATIVAASPDEALVRCPQCGSRYRVPQEPLSRPGIRLKCTMCGHVFVPVAAQSTAPDLPGSPHELFPHGEGQPGEAGAPGMGASAEPDDSRMQALFDDLREETARAAPLPGMGVMAETEQPQEAPASEVGSPDLGEPDLGTPGNGAPPKTSPGAGRGDPEHAYLEAVSLDDHAPGKGAGARAIPGDQRYKLFLNPQEFRPGETEPPADEGAADSQAAPPEPAEARTDESMASDRGAAEVSADTAGQRAELAASTPARRRPVPEQHPWLTEHRRLVLLGAIGLLVLAVAAAWAAWLMQKRAPVQLFALEFGKVHQLQLEDAEQGSYVLNQPSGVRIFVLQGNVVNRFPKERQISWVRVRGTAYADHDQKRALASATAYLGNVLSDQQLQTWTPEALAAYGAYNNGRNNSNVGIPPGGRVPYQLVFLTGGQPVISTTSQVVSYYRDGVAIYLDNSASPSPK